MGENPSSKSEDYKLDDLQRAMANASVVDAKTSGSSNQTPLGVESDAGHSGKEDSDAIRDGIRKEEMDMDVDPNDDTEFGDFHGAGDSSFSSVEQEKTGTIDLTDAVATLVGISTPNKMDDSVRMPPPSTPVRTVGVPEPKKKTVVKSDKFYNTLGSETEDDSTGGDQTDEIDEEWDKFFAAYPVNFTKECLSLDAKGDCYAVDKGTETAILGKMSDVDYDTFDHRLTADYITMEEYSHLLKPLRKALWEVGEDIKKQARRKSARPSQGDSDTDGEPGPISFWFCPESEVGERARRRIRHKGEQRKEGSLLDRAEFEKAATGVYQQTRELEEEDERKREKEREKTPPKPTVTATASAAVGPGTIVTATASAAIGPVVTTAVPDTAKPVPLDSSVKVPDGNTSENERSALEEEAVALRRRGDAVNEQLRKLEAEAALQKKEQRAKDRKDKADLKRKNDLLAKEQEERDAELDKRKAEEDKLRVNQALELAHVDPDEWLVVPKGKKKKKRGRKQSDLTEEESEEEEGQLEEDIPDDECTDTAESIGERELWENVRGGFKVRKPTCFSDCKKGHSVYGLPEPYDLNAESDDEDWLRADRSEAIPSKFYTVWLSRLRNVWLTKYYTGDQSGKILWVMDRYHSVERQTCPFKVCVEEFEEAVRFSTKPRFLRHLVEKHLHHHAVYKCLSTGKKNKKCKGYRSARRGDLVRHLRVAHAKSACDAREMVMGLHKTLMRNLETVKPGTIHSSLKFFGVVKNVTNGKLEASFGLSHMKDRLILYDPDYLQMKHHRGDEDVELVQGIIQKKADPSQCVVADITVSTPRKRPYSNRAATRASTSLEQVSPLGPTPVKQPRATDVSKQPRVTDTSRPTASHPFPPGYDRQAEVERRRREQADEQRRRIFDGDYPDGQLSSVGVDSQSRDAWATRHSTPNSSSSAARSDGAHVSTLSMPVAMPEDTSVSVPERSTETYPEDCLITQYSGKPFFEAGDHVSAEIQQEVFDKWQRDYQLILTQSSRDVRQLTLLAIQEIHDKEKIELRKVETDAVADVMRAAEEAQSIAEATQQYSMEQVSDLRQTADRMNIKFRMAFGCRLDEWNGTRQGALALLGHGPGFCTPVVNAPVGASVGTVPKPPPVPPIKNPAAKKGQDASAAKGAEGGTERMEM